MSSYLLFAVKKTSFSVNKTGEIIHVLWTGLV